MTPIPIDPSLLTVGPEWSVDGLDAPAPGAEAEGGTSFGAMLAEQVEGLSRLQAEAADASRALATGEATDPTTVVMAVERAQLAMQLASQVRTKAVDAINDVFHTQI